MESRAGHAKEASRLLRVVTDCRDRCLLWIELIRHLQNTYSLFLFCIQELLHIIRLADPRLQLHLQHLKVLMLGKEFHPPAQEQAPTIEFWYDARTIGI